MKLWITKCHGGRAIVTACCPIIAKIRGTPYLDAFERVGDPITVKHLCEPGVKALLGIDLDPLTPTKIEITARVIPRKKKAHPSVG